MIDHLRYSRRFEDLLVLPEGFAVADLKHRAVGVGQARDAELEVGPRIPAPSGNRPLIVNFCLSITTFCVQVGRDRLQAGNLLDRQIDQPLGLGGRFLGRLGGLSGCVRRGLGAPARRRRNAGGEPAAEPPGAGLGA